MQGMKLACQERKEQEKGPTWGNVGPETQSQRLH
jgi:hypothetical protein